MAIQILINTSVANIEEATLEVEHIAQLIARGHTHGDGWMIGGTNEKSVELLEDNETDL